MTVALHFRARAGHTWQAPGGSSQQVDLRNDSGLNPRGFGPGRVVALMLR